MVKNKELITSIFMLVLLQILCTSLKSQSSVAYKAENETYIVNPRWTPYGIVFTNNNASTLYLAKGRQIETLVISPGCGQYYSISPEKRYIGFKLIANDGRQQPALYDLKDKKVISLHQQASQCGQVVFSKAGYAGFSIDSSFFLLDRNFEPIRNFTLTEYVNTYDMSDDGNKLVYNDPNGQIFVINLIKNEITFISNTENPAFMPKWSPDNTHIFFSGIGEHLYIMNTATEELVDIGKGANPIWAEDGSYVLYHQNQVKDFVILGSDLMLATIDGTTIKNLTRSSKTYERDISLAEKDKVLFTHYPSAQIYIADFSKNKLDLTTKKPLLPKSRLKKNYFPIRNSKNAQWHYDAPYIHQVYDTPDWHYGYGSCAPTTSAMVFAYYKKLPPWPETCSQPFIHQSDYGNYIPDLYRFEEYYYNVSAQTSGGENAYGGYGYMWNGSYSPNSRMAEYQEKHGITSTPQYWTTNCTWERTINELANGYVQPICNYLTAAGHLVLCVGNIEGQHTLICNDPYGDKNTPGYPSYDGKNVMYDWPGFNNGYANLGGPNGYIAWTIKARNNMPQYVDSIIDDTDYENGFYIYNQEPSHMRFFRDKSTGGYNQHFWYTYSTHTSNIDTCIVKWNMDIKQNGFHNIYVYIPDSYANAQNAKYKIFYGSGYDSVLLNQNEYQSEWAPLGTFYLNTNDDPYVQLGDGTGVSGQFLAFDALSYVRKAENGINDPEKNNDIVVFPVPSKGEVSIKTKTPFKVYNSLGTLILTSERPEKTIYIHEKGLYLIKDASNCSRKFIIY